MIKKLEIKHVHDMEAKRSVRALFVDGSVFSWGIDEDSLEQAVNYCKRDASMVKAFHGSIQQHFLRSFSQFLGRPITLKELNDAIEKGEIEAPSGLILPC